MILLEWRPGGTTGEWVEPNGTVHEVRESSDGDNKDHHWFWAEDYLKTHGPHRFKDDPMEEMVARGWMRVVFSYNDSLIMVMVGHRRNDYLTKAQKEHLEDQAEETQWAVVDDDGYEIYRPYNCITKEQPLQEVTQKDIKSTMPPVRAWDITRRALQPPIQNPKLEMMTLDNLKALRDKAARTIAYYKKNQESQLLQKALKDWKFYNDELKKRMKYINRPVESTEPSIGGSYSDQATNVSGYDVTQLERDPLLDPEMNGRLEESYRFDDFGWLANMDGFNKPTDVYYGKIHLGVIESRPDGYVIIVVMGPDKHYRVDASPKNKFKNKNRAAETLHQTWKTLRTKTEV